LETPGLAAYLDDLLSRLEPRLVASVGELSHRHTPSLIESMHHTLVAGGKRVRPAVLEIWASCAGRPPEDAVLRACVGIELIHTCSLILDDLPSMDDATTRRGRPTNHRLFGEATAILAAMGLLVRAFEILGALDREHPGIRATESVANAIGVEGLVGGQHVDLYLDAESRDLEQLEYVHRHKTGALFEVAGRLGVRLGKGGDAMEEVAGIYAKNLGLAFQIKDDLLDATGHASELGKDARKDLGKPTFVSALGQPVSEEIMHRLLETARESLQHCAGADPLLAELCGYVEQRRS
jgi:geranylgeranyl diphosphate synthase type II